MRRHTKNRIFITGLLLLLFLLVTACPPNGGEEPPEENKDPFSWSDPEAPEDGTTFAVQGMDSTDRAITVGTNGEIVPDGIKVAYRYLAYLTRSSIDLISSYSAGIAGTAADEGAGSWDWEGYAADPDPNDTEDETDLDNYWANATKLFGYQSTGSFFVYLDDDSGVTRSQIKADSDNIVFFDADTDPSDDDLIVFDLSDDTFALEMDQLPPAGVEYAGIASEVVYKEVEVTGYGFLRFYYNDHGTTYKAGDVTWSADGSTGWQWVYIKHGDGIGTAATNLLSGAGCNQSGSSGPLEDPNPTDDYSENSRLYNGVDVYMKANTWTDTSGWEDPFIGKGPQNAANWNAYVACWYWISEGDVFSDFFPLVYGTASSMRRTDLSSDASLGGFGTWNDDWWNQQPYGTAPSALFSGEDTGSGTDGGGASLYDAYAVYYEPDHQQGPEDFSQPYYSTTRLPDTQVSTWRNLQENYEHYAYDSAVITPVYNDRGYWKTGPTTYIPRDIVLGIGRMEVTQKLAGGSGIILPENPSLEDSIVAVTVELFLRENLFAESDSDGEAWQNTAAKDEFDGRFLTYIPDTDEVPLSYPTDAFINYPSISMALRNYGFDINMSAKQYYSVYSRAPQCFPDPSDGPFDADLQITMNTDSSDPLIFYTTDGTDPVVDTTGATPASGNASTLLYSSGVSMTYDPSVAQKTLKAVAFDSINLTGGTFAGYKKTSVFTEAVYSFTITGNTLSGTIATTASDGTDLFVALFPEAVVDLDQEVTPAYYATVTADAGSADYTLSHIAAGTWYFLVIADNNTNQTIDAGDAVYPDQSSATTHSLVTESLTLSGDLTHSLASTAVWSTY